MIELCVRSFIILIKFGSCQEESAERTKCVFMSCEQNAGQNYNVKIGNKSFEKRWSSDIW